MDQQYYVQTGKEEMDTYWGMNTAPEYTAPEYTAAPYLLLLKLSKALFLF